MPDAPSSPSPKHEGEDLQGAPSCENPQSRSSLAQRVIESFLRLTRMIGEDSRNIPIRYASHIAVLVVSALVLVISQAKLPQWEWTLKLAPPSTDTEAAGDFVFSSRGGVENASALQRAAVPFTIIPDRPRIDIITYTVQAADTVYDLAERFGITPETVLAANPELNDDPDLLRLNQELVILPVSGVYHKVEAGDTLESIAKKYSVDPQVIVNFDWNGLDRDNPQISIGKMLIVPGGTVPYVPRVVHQVEVPQQPEPQQPTQPAPPPQPKPQPTAPKPQQPAPKPQTQQPTPKPQQPAQPPVAPAKGAGSWVWPTTGTITQRYWARHRGIDIAGSIGVQVRAADGGYVAEAGWSTWGYGNYIVIDHGNGFQTLYAHLSRFAVKAGVNVKQGDLIAYMGSTGNSTGPHLHFEIRQRGVQRDPIGFLP